MESLIDQIEIEDFVSSSGSQMRIIYCFGQKKPMQDMNPQNNIGNQKIQEIC